MNIDICATKIRTQYQFLFVDECFQGAYAIKDMNYRSLSWFKPVVCCIITCTCKS